ncbi:MAG: HAMP domain-containing sensor histidine kinase [Clostridia bacterium]|nr:HAMP domain-containing sensor histidine kinase [Clostridia bacterium]
MNKTGRVGRLLSRLPLRRALVAYVTAYLLLALLLIACTVSLCERVREYAVYNATAEVIGEDGRVVRISCALINAAVVAEVNGNAEYRLVLRTEDEPLYTLCGVAEMLCIVVWPLVCLSLAARGFYRRKLRVPLGVLRDAAQRIGRNDLDFTIDYDAPDELGRLCGEFEQMRRGVLAHERGLWRAMEERQRQTDALTHDLRTPLTVLKGQTEMLEAAAGTDRTKDMLRTMHGHILRMERYVAGLSEMRRLEDAAAQREAVSAAELLTSLRETGEALAREWGKAFELEDAGLPQTLFADAQIVQRVFDNLTGNAVRYARRHVAASLRVAEGNLVLTVRDDGPGFSQEALLHATSPFWSEEKTGKQGHLGLGLNIASLLCERCGGTLALFNEPEGGTRVRAGLGCALTGAQTAESGAAARKAGNEKRL